MVSREVGRSIGVTHGPLRAGRASSTPGPPRAVERLLIRSCAADPRRSAPPATRRTSARATRSCRPVRIKLLFGEFQARPEPGNPGFLDLDPAWVKQNIDTQHVPLLGTVTCNVSLFPQLRGVVHELIDRGLQDTIHSYSGCYSPRHINRIPSAGLSHHSWGIAVDLNVQQGNLSRTDAAPGPAAGRRVRAVGFVWGGTFIEPDGMHFEYRREPAGD